MILDSQTWRGKVARYRKWEQRHDRAVGTDIKREAGRVRAQFYMELANDARTMVEEYRNGSRTRLHESEDFLMDETHRITWTPDGYKYKIKFKHEDPERMWFQRFEHEPWFDLGYFNQATGKFQDRNATEKETFAQIVARNRAIDIQHSINMFGMKHPGYHTPAYNYTTQADHIHMAMTNTVPDAQLARHINEMKGIDPMLSSTNPDDLEAAAARAMGEAAKIRAYAALEPDGDEPTISWRWTPEYTDATTYTYVAFKADNGRWYTTGDGQGARHGQTWRDLGEHKYAEPLTRGDFLIVSEWSTVGGGE